jgi:hypothetical protein
MRASSSLVVALSLTLSVSVAWGWSEQTHRQLTADAMTSVKWLDQYKSMKVTPFDKMLRDVAGAAKPVGADAFNFKKAGTRKAKHDTYMASTAGMTDGTVQQFARHLLLSNQTAFKFVKGEQTKPISARQVLKSYSGEPDWGMDKGLDASKHQGLMGGTDATKTSSQGFRHMSFLFGSMGEAPQRAQLMFNLGRKAIEKGHDYWGFRFVAWGMHYLGDMGTPVHTNMLPTSKYIRLKGMLRPRGADGKRHFNKQILGDLVKGSANINANYHFLYENYVDKAYTGKGDQAKQLAQSVKGRQGKRPGLFSRLFAPRSVKSVAKRRGWSRLSTPSIARNAIRFFTGKFRKAAPGAADNTVGLVDKATVARAVKTSGKPLAGEGQRSFGKRIKARNVMMRRTTRQFAKNGVSMRQAINILGKQLGRSRRR